jgi:putative FmdB family regulatory protein
MPFYEYQCKNCGHDLEAMQKVNDPPLKKCPHCGKSQLQRLMSAPVFRLKGSGWYETDFKGDSDNKKNLADKPDPVAAKDAVKDTTKDSGKDAAKDSAKESDGKGKDGKAGDSKDSAKPVEKSADKPADKAAGSDSGKKAAPVKPSRRGTASPARSGAKRPGKRPAAKAKGRR